MTDTAPATLKPIADVLTQPRHHWVGDGFDVNMAFSPSSYDPQQLSPFILMDHGAARHFPPASKPRGVGPHPHRGFETVTFAYQGEIDHRDSHGGGGRIGPGDVQWMTAGSGVVHEEFHSQAFTEAGGTLEMVQLWVNLPARLKMTTPRYQALLGTKFPRLEFGSGSGRLIAGELQGQRGTADSHTPMTIFDIDLPAGGEASFELPLGHTILVFMLEGRLQAQGSRELRGAQLMVMKRDAPGAVSLAASHGERGRALVLSGEPLNEPVVAHGPFVMNTREEIAKAVEDYQRGRMGTLTPAT